MNPLAHFVQNLGHPRILVIGDAMLDRYTYGTAERVSPEAPVLVIRADEREVRLGGAASVAMLLRAMEAKPTLAAVVGDDHDGRTLRRLLDEAAIDCRLLAVDPNRPTTTKDRFLGRSEHRQPHQVLRVDTESREPLDDALAIPFVASLVDAIPDYAAVLISDYAKGACTQPLLAAVIAACRSVGVPVLVDPGRGVDFANYRRAALLKPNRSEAEWAAGHSIATIDSALSAACELRERFENDAVIVTLDKDGIVTATREGTDHFPVVRKEVCDITGAGDTVLATLGLCLAANLCKQPGCGATLDADWVASTLNGVLSKAVKLANVAAGLQVSEQGVTALSRSDLLQELSHSVLQTQGIVCGTTLRVVNPRRGASRHITNSPPGRTITHRPSTEKLVTLEEARQLAADYRRIGKTVVFTNGCFDLLHVGHITTLEQAAAEGDVLFVAINSDQSVRRLKGDDRPVVGEDERARMLASLACVDHVLVFGDATPHHLLAALKPDALVKGGTTVEIVGREIVESYGGRIVRTVERPGTSTSSLISSIQEKSALT